MVSPDGPEHQALLSAIGSATLAAGGIDTGMVFVLGALLAPVPSAGHAAELASVFIYGARSFEQRVEITKGAFHARFHLDLRAHKNNNRRRAIEFIDQLMSSIFADLSRNKWIRNFAAHGSVDLSGNEARLIPGAFDYQTGISVSKRGFPDGLTASQIQKQATVIGKDQENLMLLAIALADLIQSFHVMPGKFLASANRLAEVLNKPKLRLQDPSAGPPLRQRRPKGPKQ
jgi:hypothetical protein